MRISQHAAQRFLERVMGKDSYDRNDLQRASAYLQRVVGGIVPGSYAKPFVIPGFEEFKVIHRAGVVVTIIPKND